MDEQTLQNLLKTVQKPARYTGGEFGIAKEKKEAIRFAFAFPDVYEVGMSHLGHKILYDIFDKSETVYPQRVYAPWPDMVKALRESGETLFSLEEKRPLNKFDFVGFSLQYEMCLTNVLLMLDLGNIPLLAKDRTEHDPIVIAGGPCCVNPEPFCEIFDIITIGEGEETLPALTELYRHCRTKEEFLQKACKITGMYVPSFYEVDEATHKRTPLYAHASNVITRSLVRDFEHAPYPDHFIVPFLAPVHDRAMIEIMRGCPRGCRFCQAGMIYRPVRKRSLEKNCALCDTLLAHTGFEEISLSSLSSTDYKELPALANHIITTHAKNRVSVSLPSLRLDSFSLEAAEAVHGARKTTLTFAPEAGSQRMRDIINKNLTEEEILGTLEKAFAQGYARIKLYFMIGLPFETMEDVEEIAHLAKKVLWRFKQVSSPQKAKSVTVSLSVATFIPKPHTPFQFCGMEDSQTIREKQQRLLAIMPRGVKVSLHDAPVSRLEAVFARGDRRLLPVLLDAYQSGCIFDAWSETFHLENWKAAFKRQGLDIETLAEQTFFATDVLPWDFVHVGVAKSFLIRQYELAQQGKTSPNCFEGCAGCAINKTYPGVCKR